MSTQEAEKRTISTLFLFKPLGIIDKEDILYNPKMVEFGFRQAYIKDVCRQPLTEYPVYLLFKPNSFTGAFEEFVESEYERGLLRDDYDYPDGYVVLEYTFPEAFQEDYNKILNGAYSRTSKAFKDLFPERSNVDGMDRYSFYYRVFNKTKDMQKLITDLVGYYEDWMEVYSSPYPERETLDITKYTDYE